MQNITENKPNWKQEWYDYKYAVVEKELDDGSEYGWLHGSVSLSVLVQLAIELDREKRLAKWETSGF